MQPTFARNRMLDSLDRINTEVADQAERLGLLQQDLDDHAERLDRIAARIEANAARIAAILGD